MGMTIDEHIEVLQSYHHGFTGCAGNLQDSIDVAVDIMRKYQKIEEAYKKYQNDLVTNIYADGKFIKALCEVLEDGRT